MALLHALHRESPTVRAVHRHSENIHGYCCAHCVFLWKQVTTAGVRFARLGTAGPDRRPDQKKSGGRSAPAAVFGSEEVWIQTDITNT